MGRGRKLTQNAVGSERLTATTPIPSTRALTPTVFITLGEADINVLVNTLFDVANDKDPIVDWEYPDDDDYYRDDDYYAYGEAYAVRGNKADYAEHQLLPLAQAICWYTPTDVYATDGGELAVKTDVNHDVFVAELNKLGCHFRVQR
jgi:hypothetical protein